MARFRERMLSKEEVERIFFKLCAAIASMRDAKEASEFLRDLLSYRETEMIAIRLRIAELLEEGKTYEEIEKMIKVSHGTIAKINEWMRVSGEGLRMALERTKGKDEVPFKSAGQRGFVGDMMWRDVKKRYPMYFWPELLLEEIMLSANRKQKEKMRSVLAELEKAKVKSTIARRIGRLLSQR